MKNGIYLSGPITGVADYKANFAEVEESLRRDGLENIVNPANLDVLIPNGEYEDYMRICLELVDMCEIVVAIPGWRESKGANREVGFAIGANKKVFEWDGKRLC